MIDYLEELLDEEPWDEGFALGTVGLFRGQRQEEPEDSGMETAEKIPYERTRRVDEARVWSDTFDGQTKAPTVDTLSNKLDKAKVGGELFSAVPEPRSPHGTAEVTETEDNKSQDWVGTAVRRIAQRDAAGVSMARARVDFATGVLEELEGGGRGATALYEQMRRRTGAAAYVRRETPASFAPLTAELGSAAGLSSGELDRLCERDARRYDGGFELF